MGLGLAGCTGVSWWRWRRGWSSWLCLWARSGHADAGFCPPPFSDWSACARLSPGKYHCPVLFTVFTNNSHIVAVRTTGNVYAYEVGSQELWHLQALQVCAPGNPRLDSGVALGTACPCGATSTAKESPGLPAASGPETQVVLLYPGVLPTVVFREDSQALEGPCALRGVFRALRRVRSPPVPGGIPERGRCGLVGGGGKGRPWFPHRSFSGCASRGVGPSLWGSPL